MSTCDSCGPGFKSFYEGIPSDTLVTGGMSFCGSFFTGSMTGSVMLGTLNPVAGLIAGSMAAVASLLYALSVAIMRKIVGGGDIESGKVVGGSSEHLWQLLVRTAIVMTVSILSIGAICGMPAGMLFLAWGINVAAICAFKGYMHRGESNIPLNNSSLMLIAV
jgi:hypothetical protein